MPEPPVIMVSEDSLQAFFNQERCVERLAAGELIAVVFRDKEVSLSFEPPGTRSQMVRYIDKSTNMVVAIVHQYLRPDGTLGASGKPDPKWLYLDGAIYKPYSKT